MDGSRARKVSDGDGSRLPDASRTIAGTPRLWPTWRIVRSGSKVSDAGGPMSGVTPNGLDDAPVRPGELKASV
jgi:hypothetical protein